MTDHYTRCSAEDWNTPLEDEGNYNCHLCDKKKLEFSTTIVTGQYLSCVCAECFIATHEPQPGQVVDVKRQAYPNGPFTKTFNWGNDPHNTPVRVMWVTKDEETVSMNMALESFSWMLEVCDITFW